MSSARRTISQADYARHRGKSRQYIGRLAARGILVMHGKLIDVAASDAVLDDKPVDVEQGEPEGVGKRPAVESTRPSGSFAQAKTADMIYRAKLRKLEFETRVGQIFACRRGQGHVV